MRHLARGLAAAAAVALLTFTGSAAQAASSPDAGGALPADVTITPELEEYLATLSAEDRQDFIDTRLPASVDVEVGAQLPANAAAKASLLAADAAGRSVSPMATGCWTQRWTWGPKAAAGNTLYTYYHVGYWCSSGSTVTAASIADSGGETKNPGWRYEGVIASGSGVVSNQGRSYTQHKFVLGVGGWDVQTPLECARVKGASSGTSSADSVCGIY